jgi:hypothetical protein
MLTGDVDFTLGGQTSHLGKRKRSAGLPKYPGGAE